jgi:hypothetical protein
MAQPVWNFEQEPFVDEPKDETAVSLRAYFDSMPDDKIQQYLESWTTSQVMEWDGNFKDGEESLFLICCERDVDIAEYRRVLHQAIAYRNRVREELAGA